MAGVAKAFGMETLGLARDGKPRTNFDGTTADVDEVLRQSSVTFRAAFDADARLLDGARLRACTKRPVLINVGRGDLVSEASVVQALGRGCLMRRAGWAGRLVTPHVAALSRPEDVAKVFAANLDGDFRGRAGRTGTGGSV